MSNARAPRNNDRAYGEGDLHARVEAALGWAPGESRSFSYQALRDIVRPVSWKLANELTEAIQGGSYVTQRSRSGRHGNRAARSNSRAGRLGARAVGNRGKVLGEWSGDTVQAMIAEADRLYPNAWSVTIREDVTSDGTYQGPGRGRVVASREPRTLDSGRFYKGWITESYGANRAGERLNRARASAFDRWLDTFLSEKGIDYEDVLEVEGPSGTNYIPVGALVEMIKHAPKHEQAGIKTMLVKIDYVNAPVRPYLQHLAKAIAQ